MLALEPRLKAAILNCPGVGFERPQPEVDQGNVLRHVSLPVLMVSGRYDAVFPLESPSVPMFDVLGTSADRRKQVVLDAGNGPPVDVFVRESLAWLDKYLRPAR
jgi:hypothetical protein